MKLKFAPKSIDVSVRLLLQTVVSPGIRDYTQKNEAIFALSQHAYAVSGSSVRSLFAAYLQSFSKQSERQVIFTALTLNDMSLVASAVGFKVASVDINPNTQQPNLAELTTLLTKWPKSVVVLTPLFGAVVDYAATIKVCRKFGAHVVIDNAQGFNGLQYRHYSDYDVMFWSFGPIKTMTSLAGGVALLYNKDLADNLRRTITTYPKSPQWPYRFRVAKYTVTTLASRPLGFTVLIKTLQFMGVDPDSFMKKNTRAYSTSGDILSHITKRPSKLQQQLLYRQLNKHPLNTIQTRTSYGYEVLDHIGPSHFFGAQTSSHSFWLVPIVCKDPDQLQKTLLQHGYHASRQTSAMIVLDAHKHKNLQKTVNGLLYLPIDHTMPPEHLDLLCKIVKEAL